MTPEQIETAIRQTVQYRSKERFAVYPNVSVDEMVKTAQQLISSTTGYETTLQILEDIIYEAERISRA